MTMTSLAGVAGSKAGPKSGDSGISIPDQLYNAVSTNTPVACYYAHEDYLALVSGEVSGITDPWNSHDAAQSTAARRPHWDDTNELIIFDQSNTEYMTLDFSSGVSSGPITVVAVVDIKSTAPSLQCLFSFQTGLLYYMLDYQDEYTIYENSWEKMGSTVTGNQYLVFEHKAGEGNTEVRKDGVSLGTTMATELAMGGGAGFGAANTWSTPASHMDAEVKVAAVYSGVDATDRAAIEVILSNLKDGM